VEQLQRVIFFSNTSKRDYLAVWLMKSNMPTKKAGDREGFHGHRPCDLSRLHLTELTLPGAGFSAPVAAPVAVRPSASPSLMKVPVWVLHSAWAPAAEPVAVMGSPSEPAAEPAWVPR